MTIKRTIHGTEVEIELTKDELFNAYCEQQDEWDIKNCEDYLNSGIYDGEAWYEDLNEETKTIIIEEAASQFRRNVDKYDMSYESAIDEAFSVVLCGYAY